MKIPNLMPHQLQVKEFIKNTAYCGVFLPPGMGKTISTLTALYEAQPSGHILVIGPKNIVRSVWIDEIEKWKFPLKYKSLIVGPRGGKLSAKKRHERYGLVYEEPPTMYFINQELVPDLVEYCLNKGKWPFNNIIIDESQGFKNPASNRYKAIKKINTSTERIIELTGTPTPNGLRDLWSQIDIISPNGNALGNTFAQYDARYFTPVSHMNNRPIKWRMNKGADQEIHRIVEPIVRSADDSILDIPDILPINDVNIHLDTDEQEAYDTFKQKMVIKYSDTDDNNEIVINASNAAVLSGKLLQMASGTLYTGEKDEFVITNTKKLEYLDYLLRNIEDNVIIAYRFRAEKTIILEELKKRGHDVLAFDGSPKHIKMWNNKQVKNMLLQPASAGHGLNIQQGGHTLVWYTLPHSLEHYAQTNKRLHRIGQKHPVMIHRLLIQNTMDERMPAVLSKKRNTQQALMEAVTLELSNSKTQ